jgi:SAM-dependent methyltransferase
VTATVPETADDGLWDLERLRRARGLGDWMFEQVAPRLGPRVAEIGAGIGTFSERLLAAGVEELLLVEPEPACAAVLEGRLGGDPRVTVVEEELPEAPALCLAEGRFDLVLCQNVLEHLEDDAAATAAMARALRPGGWLVLLVPAHPRLLGALDRRYGHHRRYTRERLRRPVHGAGLELADLYSFNLLGVPGWWVAGKRRAPSLTPGSLAAYEALLRAWRPLERRVRPPWGLSLVAHARRPVEHERAPADGAGAATAR